MFQDNPNIAVFSLAFAPFEGGAEIALREVIKRLSGLNFTIFTYKFNRGWLSREKRENTDLIRVGRGNRSGRYYGRLWSKIFYVFSAWKSAEELHKQKRFEAIWALMASYGAVAALFFKLRHPRIPLLLTIQEGDSEKHLNFGKFGLVGFFGKKAVQQADYIQVISSYLKKFIEKRGAHCPIEIIPNGVDANLFNADYKESELKAVRDNLGIQDEYVIVTASRLVFKNGIDILLKTLHLLKEKRFNLKCLIIGDGDQRNSLEQLAKKLKLEKEVIFLGQISQRDLPVYFKVSDIFVRPSRSEGLGNAFLEAMAAGLPVIGTPVGGITDFLVEGETGFLADPDSLRSLAEKIEYLLENPALRKRVIKNSRFLIKNQYSWETISKLFKNIFDKLINY